MEQLRALESRIAILTPAEAGCSIVPPLPRLAPGYVLLRAARA
jgi:hypothetical protein